MGKNVLGRGLGALLGDYDDNNEELNTAGSTEKNVETKTGFEIDITRLYPNANQARKIFDEEALKELAASIKTHGIISPIVVVPKDGGQYMIIAGERRYRASLLAGLLRVPIIVKDYTEREIKEISLIENLQREDLNPIESARAIKELMDEYRFTQEDIAERLGKKRPTIANAVRLLSLQPEVINLVETNRLSAGHARCLIPIEDAAGQIKFAKASCDNKVTVRDLEKAVRDYLAPKPEKKSVPEQSLELRDLVAVMQRTFATKVSAMGNDRKGRIFIDYYSTDDLNRILETVTKVAPKLN